MARQTRDNELAKAFQEGLVMGDLVRIIGGNSEEVYQYTAKGIVRDVVTSWAQILTVADEDGRGLRPREVEIIMSNAKRLYLALAGNEQARQIIQKRGGA